MSALSCCPEIPDGILLGFPIAKVAWSLDTKIWSISGEESPTERHFASAVPTELPVRRSFERYRLGPVGSASPSRPRSSGTESAGRRRGPFAGPFAVLLRDQSGTRRSAP
jgi:hypothetical protein